MTWPRPRCDSSTLSEIVLLRFQILLPAATKSGGSGEAGRAVGRVERGGNERPGRYSGTVELNSVTRSATPDETYQRFFPVNPITSSNDRGCSSGLSYERQDRGKRRGAKERGEERKERTYTSSGGELKEREANGKKYKNETWERVREKTEKRERKWLP